MIDGVGDETGNILATVEKVREGFGETGSNLGGREGNFTDRISLIESENRPGLIVINKLLHAQDRLVHVSKVGTVGEDECFIGIEAGGDDVLGVFEGETLAVLQFEVLDQELFVIGHLDYNVTIEDTL